MADLWIDVPQALAPPPVRALPPLSRAPPPRPASPESWPPKSKTPARRANRDHDESLPWSAECPASPPGICLPFQPCAASVSPPLRFLSCFPRLRESPNRRIVANAATDALQLRVGPLTIDSILSLRNVGMDQNIFNEPNDLIQSPTSRFP